MSIGYTSTYEYLKEHYGEEAARRIVESREKELKSSFQESHENAASRTLMQNMIDAGLYDANELSQKYSSSSRAYSSSISNHIDSESNQARRILTNNKLFNQEKLNQNSIIYKMLAFDLFELNGVDERLISNKVLRYSDKINEYYKQKFGRVLFDSRAGDEVAKELEKAIDKKEFQQYYKFGHHSLDAQRHTLKIDSKFLKDFSKHVFDDQKFNQFDLTIKDILPSPNYYDVIDKTQRQRIVHINMPNKHKVRWIL